LRLLVFEIGREKRDNITIQCNIKLTSCADARMYLVKRVYGARFVINFTKSRLVPLYLVSHDS